MRPSAGATLALGPASEALSHAPSLYNLARRLSASDSDAEDLVQETYARALGGAATFAPGTNLRAWLFRILRNAWVDLLRRRRRDPAGGGQPGLEPNSEPPAEEQAQGPELLRGDLELDRLRRVVSAEIEAALGQLGEEARTVVLLDLEGLTEVEVAEVMGCAVGTVKSRLSRARAALRRLLQHYAPPEATGRGGTRRAEGAGEAEGGAGGTR